MDYEKELGILKENLERAKNLKYKADAKLEQLNKMEHDIIQELKVLNISPDKLESEISKLTNDINILFKEANDLLPKDLLEKK